LPGWLSTIAQGLPVTHGVEAARELMAGSSLAEVAPLLGAELLVGAIDARRGASLGLA
jgi:ABC-2 type transport system permease protein